VATVTATQREGLARWSPNNKIYLRTKGSEIKPGYVRLVDGPTRNLGHASLLVDPNRLTRIMVTLDNSARMKPGLGYAQPKAASAHK
jgi:hypothetical protein